MLFNIEKNVVLPLPLVSLYPFAKMAPGDSFAIPAVPVGRRGGISRSRAYASLYAASARFMSFHPGVKLLVRASREKPEVRCWRTT